jgi:hypothetical protein
MRIPIACTLSADGAATRLDEWRALLTRVVASTERSAQTELALRVRPEPGDLDRLVDLVQREAGCCTFFEFALQITADAVTLRVTVPADAAPVLDGFAALAESPQP